MKQTLFQAARQCISNWVSYPMPNLYSPGLQKCYFLYNHKQICSKVTILLCFVKLKGPSGNCYVNCFLTEKHLCLTPTPSTHSFFLISVSMPVDMFWFSWHGNSEFLEGQVKDSFCCQPTYEGQSSQVGW